MYERKKKKREYPMRDYTTGLTSVPWIPLKYT